MTSQEVITSVRALIGDTNSDKWSSQQVLDALNDSRSELVRQTGILKASSKITINVNEQVYKLPKDCFYLTRALCKGVPIPFISMEELDNINESWTDEIGTEIKYLIYDNLNQCDVMIYPALCDTAESYEVVGTNGPITGISGIDNLSLYGAITDIKDDTQQYIVTREDSYGALTDINDNITLDIYYVKKPETLTSGTQDIEIDSIYKMYLVYKTAAELLSYDNNSNNINKSVLFDNKALSQIKDIKNNNSSDYVQDKNITFGYKGAFDD